MCGLTMRWNCPPPMFKFNQTFLQAFPKQNNVPLAPVFLMFSSAFRLPGITGSFPTFSIVNTDVKCAWQGPKERHQHFCVLCVTTQAHRLFPPLSYKHSRLYCVKKTNKKHWYSRKSIFAHIPATSTLWAVLAGFASKLSGRDRVPTSVSCDLYLFFNCHYVNKY